MGRRKALFDCPKEPRILFEFQTDPAICCFSEEHVFQLDCLQLKLSSKANYVQLNDFGPITYPLHEALIRKMRFKYSNITHSFTGNVNEKAHGKWFSIEPGIKQAHHHPQTLLLKVFRLILFYFILDRFFFYFMCMSFMCMYVCATCTCLVPTEVGRGQGRPGNFICSETSNG